MAYIAPNTDIVLCKNVPLDASYDHTLTFANANAQWSYFYSKAYKILSVNSYQRVMRNKLRVQCTIDEAVQCNYLYFNNSNFEQKFFYAFITGWEYVNNVTTEITYEIDVFQTFWFDVDIKPSFVEREHSNTDLVGENLVPENLELGDYTVAGRAAVQPYAISGTVATNACVIFLTTFNDDASFTPFIGGFASNVYTGLNVIKKETVNDVQTFITNVTNANKIDGIIAAYMCPFSPNTYDTLTWDIQINKPSTLGNYTPKNKKLLTYPFNLLHVYNDINSADFHYEYFNAATCTFRMRGLLIPEPTLTLLPTGYNLPSGSTVQSSELRISTRGYPQVAINADIFKVYLAQNAASLPTSMISSGVQSGIKAVAAGLRGDLGGVVTDFVDWGSSIANKLAQMHDISTKPPQQNGTQTCLTDYAIGCKVIYAENLCVRPEFAQIIDDYFSMFGYATHRVKIPNITGRPYWNYVKTQGIVLDIANAPQPYIEKMISCFNKGITFWHYPNLVGRYDLDNSPT